LDTPCQEGLKTLEGKSLIGQQAVAGNSSAIHAANPATGEQLDPAYAGGSAAELNKARPARLGRLRHLP
jgi:hypothetical protein